MTKTRTERVLDNLSIVAAHDELEPDEQAMVTDAQAFITELEAERAALNGQLRTAARQRDRVAAERDTALAKLAEVREFRHGQAAFMTKGTAEGIDRILDGADTPTDDSELFSWEIPPAWQGASLGELLGMVAGMAAGAVMEHAPDVVMPERAIRAGIDRVLIDGPEPAGESA
ncbi:MAG: hypothetical protein AAGA90_24040 [Actinomycetota bacterium]